MRIAIISNNSRGYIPTMAESLRRMFGRIGVESKIFTKGLYLLDQTEFFKESIPRKLRTLGWRALNFPPFLLELRKFDAIVLTHGLPGAFVKPLRIELLRRFFPHTPIVLYDVVYLPTRYYWGALLKTGSPAYGILGSHNYGLERYDWYLCASVVSGCAMPRGPQPYSEVGVDFDDGSLYPDQRGEFLALVDFRQPGRDTERAIQIEALEETDTRCIELQGSYARSEIRDIYRRTSIYFLATTESFGLPICELQLCGSYVFAAQSVWCQSHWIKKDLHAHGPGSVSPNFVVYDNDKAKLMREIERIRRTYDPARVRETFSEHHPQLAHGDTNELRRFVRKLASGEINADSHRAYADIVSPLVDPS